MDYEEHVTTCFNFYFAHSASVDYTCQWLTCIGVISLSLFSSSQFSLLNILMCGKPSRISVHDVLFCLFITVVYFHFSWWFLLLPISFTQMHWTQGFPHAVEAFCSSAVDSLSSAFSTGLWPVSVCCSLLKVSLPCLPAAQHLCGRASDFFSSSYFVSWLRPISPNTFLDFPLLYFSVLGSFNL